MIDATSPPQIFIDDIILGHARATPEAIAIKDKEGSLTYGELADAINNLCQALSQAGVKSGDFVIPLIPPCRYITIALLATQRCGAIYAPLDPELPTNQLQEKINIINSSLLLTAGNAAPQIPHCKTIDLLQLPQQQSTFIPPVRHDEDKACIFFTSGTSGVPKGVVGTALALRDSIVEPALHLGFTHNDTLNSIARYTWSISMLELLAPLSQGGTSLILERSQALNLDLLKQSAEQCTAFHCPPALLKTLSEHIEQHYPDNQTLNHIRVVWYGGDTFAPNAIERLQRVFPSAQIGTAYGATEIFGLSHCHLYDRQQPIQRVLIGKPVGHMQQRVIDASGNLMSSGVGELFMGGPRIAQQYWQQPELSAEKFPTIDGTRYYATGDQVRLDDNGDLEYLQRQDDLVKIRGIRIELGEIEFHLRQVPGIKNAAVITSEDEDHSRELIAFITFSEDTHIDPSHTDPLKVSAIDQVRQSLSKLVPDYMIPARLYELQDLPYTENFKIDRKKLGEYHHNRQHELFLSSEIPADFTDSEKQLAELWQAAAQTSPLSRDDNFFEIGGSSITAAKLISLIHQRLHISVEVADIYMNPSLDKMHNMIASRQSAPTTNSDYRPSDSNLGNSAIHPAGLNQTGLFFRELREHTDSSITCTRYITSSQGFDEKLIDAALQILVKRYPTLTTAVKPGKGTLLLEPQGSNNVQFSIERTPGIWRLSDIPDRRFPKARQLGKNAHKFNLRKPPFISAILSTLTSRDELLQLTAHHIAADDNSMGRLANDFIAIYDSLAKGKPYSLLPIVETYEEFLTAQETLLTRDSTREMAQQIADRMLTHLAQNPDPIITTQSRLGESGLSALKPLPSSTEDIAFVDFVAALAWAMHQCYQRRDFVFCAHVALRRDTPDNPRVGMFVNLAPLFISIAPGQNYQDCQAIVKKSLDEAMARSHIPYELILKQSDTLRLAGKYPFDAFINELRFEDNYPDGYNDVVVQRSFVTDGHEISMSRIKTLTTDSIKLESPEFMGGHKQLEELATLMVSALHV